MHEFTEAVILGQQPLPEFGLRHKAEVFAVLLLMEVDKNPDMSDEEYTSLFFMLAAKLQREVYPP